jgi:hypothetical protein
MKTRDDPIEAAYKKAIRTALIGNDGERFFTEKQLVAYGDDYAKALFQYAIAGIIDELARHANELQTLSDNLRKQYQR